MHAPAETPKSEGDPRKTAAETNKARKKPEWVRTLQVRWLTSNAFMGGVGNPYKQLIFWIKNGKKSNNKRKANGGGFL